MGDTPNGGEGSYVPQYIAEMQISRMPSPGSSTVHSRHMPDYGFSFRTPDKQHFIAGSLNIGQNTLTVRYGNEKEPGPLTLEEHRLPEQETVGYGMTPQQVRNALVRFFGYQTPLTEV